MKAVAALVCSFALVVAVSALSQELQDAMKKAKAVCNDKFHLSEDTVGKLVNHKALPESHDEKCFLDCVMREFHIIEDNHINLSTVKTINKKKYEGENLEKADQVADNCFETVNKQESYGECELAVAAATCVETKLREAGVPAVQYS